MKKLNESTSESLLRIALIERDTNNDVRMVWSFPRVSEAEEELVKAKSGLTSDTGLGLLSRDSVDFLCGRLDGSYHYLNTMRASTLQLPKVTAVCLVVFSDEFHPNKYRQLGSSLLIGYLGSANPTQLVDSLLSLAVHRSTHISAANMLLTRQALDLPSPTKLVELVQRFSMETILLYTAVLLNKKIMINFDPKEVKKDDILTLISTLLIFLPSTATRPPIYAYISTTDQADYQEMRSQTSYIAAISMDHITAVQESCDLLVDLNRSTITVAEHSKDFFVMGKLQKDVAHLLTESVESEDEDFAVRTIQQKTNEIIGQLATIAHETGQITRDSLSARQLAPATANFLLNLASAQNALLVAH